VRLLIALLALVGPGCAESHPSWWNYASPQATALVGIRWARVVSSPFAEVVSEELSSDGGLGFPDVECLKSAQQILISSPELLAIESGTFPAATVREQAASKGWKHSSYRGLELWITPGKETLSIAQISDQLVLLGHVKTLQDAIDRSLAETGRAYSPLLARAARYSQKDLWVVASRLPDPLADVFVPLDVEADAFAGSVSLDDGLHLEASITAGSDAEATGIANALRHDLPAMPSIGRGLRIDTDASSVRLTIEADADQLAAGLRKPEVAGSAIAETQPVVVPKPVAAPKPQVIRIWGLDEGLREIVVRRP
jgi:hypothetical protein